MMALIASAEIKEQLAELKAEVADTISGSLVYAPINTNVFYFETFEGNVIRVGSTWESVGTAKARNYNGPLGKFSLSYDPEKALLSFGVDSNHQFDLSSSAIRIVNSQSTGELMIRVTADVWISAKSRLISNSWIYLRDLG